MNDIKKLLIKVENGEISSEEAANIFRTFKHDSKQIKYAKKIKIKVHDRKDKKKINLPPIPIWIVEKFFVFGLRFVNYFSKEKNESRIDIHKKSRKKLNDSSDFLIGGKNKIDVNDVKVVFSALRHIPPCKLVEVDDEDAFVEIHMI